LVSTILCRSVGFFGRFSWLAVLPFDVASWFRSVSVECLECPFSFPLLGSIVGPSFRWLGAFLSCPVPLLRSDRYDPPKPNVARTIGKKVGTEKERKERKERRGGKVGVGKGKGGKVERKLVEGGKTREWKEGTKVWNGKETESVAWEWNRERKAWEWGSGEGLGSGNSMVVAIRSQGPSGREDGRSVSSQNPERRIVNS